MDRYEKRVRERNPPLTRAENTAIMSKTRYRSWSPVVLYPSHICRIRNTTASRGRRSGMANMFPVKDLVERPMGKAILMSLWSEAIEVRRRIFRQKLWALQRSSS